jgi:hypothetical protein
LELTRLNQGEKIAGIAGIVLIIIMFFSWWGGGNVSGEINGVGFNVSTNVSFNAWELSSFMDIIWFVTGLAAIGLALLAASEAEVGLPVAASAIATALGALSTLLILYRLIDPPYDASRKFGVFLGLIAAAAVAYGGYLAMQEEGTTFGDQADRLRDRPGGGPGTGPPPPPPPTSGGPPPTSGGPPPPSGP